MTVHLDETRIDAMREQVLDAVDADTRRRGRRARRIVSGTAAACLVVVVGGVGSQLVTSGSEPGPQAKSIAASDSAAPGSGAQSTERDDARGYSSNGSLSDDSARAEDEDVVTTGRVTATVRDVEASVARLDTWLRQHHGSFDDQSRTGRGDAALASLTLRVPSDQVQAAVAEIGRLGRVDDVSIQRADVGTQRRDLDARIDALQISVERLKRIMASADRSSDLLAAERSLSQRQASLESLQSQRRALADQVSRSTLQVELSTRTSAQAPSDDGFTSGLVDGWNALVSAVSAVVLAVGFALPWLGVALVVAALVVAIRYRRR